MNFAIPLAGFLFLVTVSSAQGQEPLTFKGFELGADRETVLAAFPKPYCTGSPEKGDTCMWSPKDDCPRFATQGPCFEAFNYGGVLPNTIMVTFYKARFASARVYYPEPRFRQLRDAITERFGKPATEKTEVVQNRAGATFDNITMLWQRGDALLILRQRAGRVDEGTVSITSKTFMEEMKEQDKAAIKDRAKKL